MKWKHLLLFLLALSGPRRCGAILGFLEEVINGVFAVLGSFGIWDTLARGLCNTMENLLPDGFLDCRCSGSYRAGRGLGGELFCSIGNEVCLIPGEKKNDEDL